MRKGLFASRIPVELQIVQWYEEPRAKFGDLDRLRHALRAEHCPISRLGLEVANLVSSKDPTLELHLSTILAEVRNINPFHLRSHRVLLLN